MDGQHATVDRAGTDDPARGGAAADVRALPPARRTATEGGERPAGSSQPRACRGKGTGRGDITDEDAVYPAGDP